MHVLMKFQYHAPHTGDATAIVLDAHLELYNAHPCPPVNPDLLYFMVLLASIAAAVDAARILVRTILRQVFKSTLDLSTVSALTNIMPLLHAF